MCGCGGAVWRGDFFKGDFSEAGLAGGCGVGCGFVGLEECRKSLGFGSWPFYFLGLNFKKTFMIS
ncbi:hypothetical protein LM7421_140050 [Listeria monocytogenes]|nr:hypothetical protein LM7421_140050 [Listeria monocytogenes]